MEGITLFNRHRFFEYHEVLERLWLGTVGRPRGFSQGLIQAAVVLYYWSRGHAAGARNAATSAFCEVL